MKLGEANKLMGTGMELIRAIRRELGLELGLPIPSIKIHEIVNKWSKQIKIRVFKNANMINSALSKSQTPDGSLISNL